jgi:hypothetical protein
MHHTGGQSLLLPRSKIKKTCLRNSKVRLDASCGYGISAGAHKPKRKSVSSAVAELIVCRRRTGVGATCSRKHINLQSKVSFGKHLRRIFNGNQNFNFNSLSCD